MLFEKSLLADSICQTPSVKFKMGAILQTVSAISEHLA